MPRLIVKPTINFLSTDSDVGLLTNVGVIIARLANNKWYADPQPSLDVVSTAHEDFQNAVGAASLGGVMLTATKNAKRRELIRLVRDLASYVTSACKGDLMTLMSSGFPNHKLRREPIGTKPATPKTKHGDKSGELKAATQPVRGVFIYSWRLALASDPETYLEGTQTTGSKVMFEGLIPGQLYCISVSATGAAGATDFSGAGRLMAI